jgi:hypothetical protein
MVFIDMDVAQRFALLRHTCSQLLGGLTKGQPVLKAFEAASYVFQAQPTEKKALV